MLRCQLMEFSQCNNFMKFYKVDKIKLIEELENVKKCEESLTMNCFEIASPCEKLKMVAILLEKRSFNYLFLCEALHFNINLSELFVLF